jgi:hypothetical protein
MGFDSYVPDEHLTTSSLHIITLVEYGEIKLPVFALMSLINCSTDPPWWCALKF